MNEEPPQEQPPPGPEEAGAGSDPAPAGGEQPPSEEELRARIEEGLRTVRVQDVVLESAVTLVNITARRIAKEDERDLEQARVGIEAVRGLGDLLEGEPQAQLRNALSELQMIYAREAGGQGAPASSTESAQEPASETAAEPAQEHPESEETPAQGERKPPPGLWVPPGSA